MPFKFFRKNKIPARLRDRNYINDPLSSKNDVLPSVMYSEQDVIFYFGSQKRKKLEQSKKITRWQFQLDNDDDQQIKKTATFYVGSKKLELTKYSLLFFGNRSRIRYFSLFLHESLIFKFFIIGTILANCALLGAYDYSPKAKPTTLNTFIEYFQPFVLGVFLLEMISKMIAYGLTNERGYFYKIMNYLDLAVVASGIFYFNEHMRFMSIIRLFRIIYVMKKHMILKGIGDMVNIFKSSIVQILIILLFLFFFVLIFAILALNLWKGKLNYRCRLTPAPLNGTWPVNSSLKRACGEGHGCPVNNYCGSNFNYNRNSTSFINGNIRQDTNIKELNYGITNFDNIFYSLYTVFQVTMIEGWPDIMFILDDATEISIASIFLILVFMICRYFISNMLVAEFMNIYLQKHNKEKHQTSFQRRFIFNKKNQNDEILMKTEEPFIKRV